MQIFFIVTYFYSGKKAPKEKCISVYSLSSTSKSHAGQSPAFLCRLCCKFPQKICGSKNPNFSRITSASKRFHYINGFFHFLRQLDGQSTWIQKNVTRWHVRIQKNGGSPIWYTRYFRDVAETLKRLIIIDLDGATGLCLVDKNKSNRIFRCFHALLN